MKRHPSTGWLLLFEKIVSGVLVILVKAGLLIIICCGLEHAIVTLCVIELSVDFIYSLVWYSCIIHVSCVVVVTLLEDELLIS